MYTTKTLNHKCSICQQLISQERFDALQILNINPLFFTCFNCSLATIKPIKGIYTSFSGASPMILVDDIGEEGICKEE